MLIWKCLAMWRRPMHRADRLADRRGTVQRTAPPAVRGPAMCASSFSVTANSSVRLRPLFGQQRVLADHQALAGIVGAGDLGHIAIIKQRGLQRPAFGGELLDPRSRPAR